MMNRHNSTICPTAEERLLEYAKNNKPDQFEVMVRNTPGILQHIYPSHTRSILPISILNEYSVEVVRKLIELGASVTGDDNNESPLHLAVQNRNPEVLQALFDSKKLNANELVQGETALHTLAKTASKENQADFVPHVQILLRNNLNVNAGNTNNTTAITFAAKNGLKDIVKAILDESCCEVLLEQGKLRNKTAKEWIESGNLYDLSTYSKKELPSKIDTKTQLFNYIKTPNADKDFMDLYDKENYSSPNEDDSESTLLQAACQYDRASIVDFLIDKGADKCKTTAKNLKLPIHIAVENCHFDIALRLSDTLDANTLCELIRNYNSAYKRHEHQKFVREILGISPAPQTGADSDSSNVLKKVVNQVDYTGNSPLYLSLFYADEEVSLKLLQYGASLAYKNSFGFMPIDKMKEDLLKKHLDSCLLIDEKPKSSLEDYKIIMNCGTLIPQVESDKSSVQNQANHEMIEMEPLKDSSTDKNGEIALESTVPEMVVLAQICKKPDLKHLLKHPVLVSIIHLKWHSLRWLFWINLLVYVCFFISLTTYIFTEYANFSELRSTACQIFGTFSYGVLFVSYVILWARELFQFIVSTELYMRTFDNLIEVLLLILTTIIVFNSKGDDDMKKQVAAIAIIVSAFELVLMVGTHPKFCTNVVMFKTVSKNFFRLFLWYLLLIIAFALSFNILFTKSDRGGGSSNATDGNDDDDVFTGPGPSLFKTFVMLTGEFDAGSIDFHKYPVISRLVFILFVFTISIILLNLLTGLAVSDTHTIKNDAELVGYETRVKYLSYVENMLLGKLVQLEKIKRVFCCFPHQSGCHIKNPFSEKVALSQYKISMFPHQHGRLKWEIGETNIKEKKMEQRCFCMCRELFLGNDIGDRAIEIVKRNNFNGSNDRDELIIKNQKLEKTVEELQNKLMAVLKA